MSRALGDVLVVDLTTELWSGLAAALLGDFGAEVVRVEDTSAAGASHAVERDGEHPPASRGHLADLAQRNKRSVAVDLDDAAGREILRALVARADVFVTDLPAARLAELGCDAAACEAAHPGLVYARGSGFGPRGPDRDLPGLDELAAARTGVMPTLPEPGQPPVYPGSGPLYAAVMLATGALLALHHRADTGKGQTVDASLLAGNMYGASLDLQAFLAIGGTRFLGPESRYDKGNPMSGTLYPSRDGRWVVLTMPDTDRWWPGFCEAVGLDAADPRFDGHEKRCGPNRRELMQVLEATFRRETGAHWRAVFDAKQLSADVVESYDYPAGDPLAYRNHYLLALDDPHRGAVRTVGFPVHLSEGTPRLRRTAPARGQHSAEILQDVLGWPDDRIDAAQQRGVVG
jgi:formyl-CoA transferase